MSTQADFTGTVSFRAECPEDVDRLLATLPKGTFKVSKQVTDEPYSDNEVELLIEHPLSISKLYDLMSSLPYGHVMPDTLRSVPQAQNSMERRFGQKPINWTA